MSMPRLRRRFTLVELAVLFVALGVLTVLVIKGREWVEQARFDGAYADLKSLENLVWTYRERMGHWPGDCDADGVIGFRPEHSATPGSSLSTGDEIDRDCSSSAENADAPFSALRGARLIDPPNAAFAMKIGSGGVRIGSENNANLIVVYGIPAWMAQMLDVSMDGQEQAVTGRIRRWDVAAGSETWPEEDESVAMAYFFGPSVP